MRNILQNFDVLVGGDPWHRGIGSKSFKVLEFVPHLIGSNVDVVLKCGLVVAHNVFDIHFILVLFVDCQSKVFERVHHLHALVLPVGFQEEIGVDLSNDLGRHPYLAQRLHNLPHFLLKRLRGFLNEKGLFLCLLVTLEHFKLLCTLSHLFLPIQLRDDVGLL